MIVEYDKYYMIHIYDVPRVVKFMETEGSSGCQELGSRESFKDCRASVLPNDRGSVDG